MNDATLRLSSFEVALQSQFFCQRCLIPVCRKHVPGKDIQQKLIIVNKVRIYAVAFLISASVVLVARQRSHCALQVKECME